MTIEAYECELCGDTYTSLRAAILCEEADLEDERQARRNGRAPRAYRHTPND